MLKEILLGERITLKRPKADTVMAKVVFAAVEKSRKAFSPWLEWVDKTNSASDSLEFLKEVDKDWNENNQFVYAIYWQDKFVGLISAINIARQHKRVEIGYWLDTGYVGKGLMSEAVSLLEEELFANDFNRIFIHTDVLNIKSAAIPQRLGYVHEGVLRQAVYSEPLKRFRDMNVFSKLRSDKK